jgi:hypothetical protein
VHSRDTAPVCTSAAPGDLITNGHFESGTSAWNVLAVTQPGSVIWNTVVLDDAKGCGSALHFVSTGAGSESSFQVGQKIATVAGQGYTLTFRIKRVGDDDSQWMSMGVQKGTPFYHVDGRDDESWAAWGTFENMFTSTGDDTFYITVGSHGAGETEWFFDSIEVLPL